MKKKKAFVVIFFFLVSFLVSYLHGQEEQVDKKSVPTKFKIEDSSNLEINYKRKTDEQKLLDKLLPNSTLFRNNTIPNTKDGRPLVVSVGFTLSRVFAMVARNNSLITITWIDSTWNDPAMTWNPQDFGNISIFRIPSKFIWKPDIIIFNTAKQFNHPIRQERAMLANNGNIFYSSPAQLQTLGIF